MAPVPGVSALAELHQVVPVGLTIDLGLDGKVAANWSRVLGEGRHLGAKWASKRETFGWGRPQTSATWTWV